MTAHPWHRGRLIAFDTETTGVDVNHDRIVTASAIILDGTSGRTLSENHWLITPDIPIPDTAAAIHGVTDAHARKHGQPATTALTDILECLTWATGPEGGATLIAYNGGFDMTILDREARRNRLTPYAPALLVDAMVMYKHTRESKLFGLPFWRKGEKKTLAAACECLGVTLDGAHTANGDALAGARVAWTLTDRHPAQWQVPPANLATLMATLAGGQEADYAKYRRKTDPAFTPATGWPVRDLPDGWDPAATPEPVTPVGAVA